MAKPLVATFGKCVIASVQPVGLVTDRGLVAMKSAPGTHESQKVPMESLPAPLVFVSVTV